MKKILAEPDVDDIHGRINVVIDRVSPSVDCGLFPVKRLQGESVDVTAWVFAEGHDVVVVRLRYRGPGDAGWEEVPMRALGNDEWAAEFTPDALGLWEFSVMGWVDAFQTWRTGFQKKVADGQNPDIELAIGAGLIAEAAHRATGDDAAQIAGWAKAISSSSSVRTDRVNLALSDAVNVELLRYADRTFAMTSQAYPVLVERERAGFSAWYEFFPRSWGASPGDHGTFRTAARVLPEIASLGFDIVYIPPIHPIGQTFRKGRNNALKAATGDVGSPWAIGSADGGHKSIHPELGDFDAFASFIRTANDHGLEVALDIAFQCSPDHPYVKDHPDWFKWRPDGTVQYAENPPKKYQDIIPFDFACEDWKALWIELRSVFEFWIERGIRVFRVDNPHTKPLQFWNWCILSLKESYPDVIFLAEAFTRPKIKYWLGKAGFSHGYTYFTWRTTKDELMQYLDELTQSAVAEFFRPNFWPNTPDILHEFLVHGGPSAHAIRLVLAATLSSNFGIYGPAFELCENQPFPGKEEYNHNEKYEIKAWDWDRPGNLKYLIQRVNRIRRENRALQHTNNLRFVQTDNAALIAYYKSTRNQENTILTVVNLDPHNTQMGWLDFPIQDLGISDSQSYRVLDLLPVPENREAAAGAEYTWRGARNFIKLDPSQAPAHIFRILS